MLVFIVLLFSIYWDVWDNEEGTFNQQYVSQ